MHVCIDGHLSSIRVLRLLFGNSSKSQYNCGDYDIAWNRYKSLHNWPYIINTVLYCIKCVSISKKSINMTNNHIYCLPTWATRGMTALICKWCSHLQKGDTLYIMVYFMCTGHMCLLSAMIYEPWKSNFIGVSNLFQLIHHYKYEGHHIPCEYSLCVLVVTIYSQANKGYHLFSFFLKNWMKINVIELFSQIKSDSIYATEETGYVECTARVPKGAKKMDTTTATFFAVL